MPSRMLPRLMALAGSTDVGIVLHGHYQSLLDHLGTGKDWDLSRKRGGLRLLPPFNYQQNWGVMPFRGKIEALANVRSYLETIRQDYCTERICAAKPFQM